MKCYEMLQDGDILFVGRISRMQTVGDNTSVKPILF